MDFITNLIIAAIVGGACEAATSFVEKEKDSSEK